MPKKKKSLPKPPSAPFGQKKRFQENRDDEPLLADRMAMAMSEGKLDEFLEQEMPGSEYARKLADMMMGMTGMVPGAGFPSPARKSGEASELSEEAAQEAPPAAEPPDDVVNAVQSADVAGLIDLLKREHRKRHGAEGEQAEAGEKGKASPEQPSPEKQLVKDMMQIAADNSVSLDWIFFRALKRYVDEYRKRGSL
ncbi:MAG: hypothetical protein JSU90_10745 [Nitrospiraceae bacterium]|nr:MAG: hypothetical protein JSU90_10745 [Nitrospiraceae bacterium]